MNQQKKYLSATHKKSAHLRQTQSMIDLPRYGPPSPQPFKIQPTLGINLKKTPTGLRKKKWKFLERQERLQSNANLAMKVGDLNIFRRFKKINYLKNWLSKKPVFNICEQKIISRLHQNLQRIKIESRENTRCKQYSSFGE